MTGVAALLGGFAFSLNDILVALLAGDVAGPDKIQMVESKSFKLDILPGNLVAGRAISQRKRADLGFGMFKMTEVAGTFGHLDMRPNDDLGVTASTTELLAPT
jgi:hypothetical protein